MFGKPKLRRDLPPIDIRKKKVQGLLGPKMVPASKNEQRQMKAELIKKYPDRLFLDDLKEWNSVDDLAWIDCFEAIDAIFDD